MKTHSFLLMLLMAAALCMTANATTYYANKTVGADPTLVANWGTATDGTGSHPANFTSASDIFIIEAGADMDLLTEWTVAGTIDIECQDGGLRMPKSGTGSLQVGTLDINGQFICSRNLTVTGATTLLSYGNLLLAGTSQSISLADLTIASTANLHMNDGATVTITINGNFTNNSTSTVFAPRTILFKFAGSEKTLSGISPIPSVEFTGNYTNNGTLTCATDLKVTGAAIRLTNNGTITASTSLSGTGGVTQGATGVLNIGGTAAITTLDASTNAGNTVKYTGAGQTGRVATYSNLTLNGTGTTTFATSPTVNGTLSIEGTASVVITTGVVTYGSDAKLQYSKSVAYAATSEEWISPFTTTGGIVISGTGAITPPALREIAAGSLLTIKSGASIATNTPTYKALSTLKYQGGSAQTTTTIELPSPMAGHVTIDNTAGVSLGASTTLNGTLTFTSGNLLLGANTLTLGNLGSSGATSGACVVTNSTGVVKTNIEDGGSFTFPIGPTTTTYNPVTIKSNKTVTIEGTGADYTALVKTISPAASVAANSLNYMWTLTGASAPVTMSFSWTNSEAGSGLAADPACGVAYQYATDWTDMGGSTTVGSPNVTSGVTTSAPTGNWTIGGNLTAYPGAGSGLSGNPYIVSSMAHLTWISQNSTVWGRYFTQTATIDASSSATLNSNGSGGYYGWSPIGNGTKPFRGSYNGGGYKIDNLYINRVSTDSVGFFGYTYGGAISNLGLRTLNITGQYYVGGLAGFGNGTSFSNCSTTGAVSAAAIGGGLASEIDNATVTSCYSSVSLTSTEYGTLGGLGGRFIGATVSNCYATGSVNAGTAAYSGGFAASCGPTTTVDKCYSTGAVTGGTYTGGFTGYHSPTLTNCFWNTETSGQLTSADGTPKTTAEMKTASTFTNTSTSVGLTEAWDVTTVWQVNGNYPDLRTNLNSALPVELASFTSTTAGNRVDLAWRTSTEVNNYGFDIERQSANGWSTVGFVEGHGTTNAPQSYTFTDTPGSGKFEYRLKQIDRDGKFAYSHTVEAYLAMPVAFGLEQNYPNPFNPTTNISFVIPVTGQARLTVFNILGEQVSELFNGISKAGEKQTLAFDASKRASGVYFYRLEGAGKIDSKKMQLIR